ncbi:MAG TPA: MFS transporter [Ignavibacteria bacterium]|nr:MFS transporter [Ignavibacteria bacterium]HMQ97700.1 MFS transporter [Ignavibacteria bacterium]
MRKIILPVTLGLAHGVSDCSAGLILGSLSNSISIYGVGSMVLLYNVLAFGAQPLAGLLTDKLKNPRLAVLTGLFLMAAAVIMYFINPFAAVLFAGLASAVFHVGGGALALCSTPDRSSGAGLFSAPGVAGLAIGGYLAVSEIFPAAVLIALLSALAVFIFALKIPVLPYNAPRSENEFEKHDFIMLVLLLAIALRSAVWNIFQHIEQGEITNIILISISAAGGKIIGGYAGDLIGWRRYSFSALIIAVPLLILGESSIYFLLPGIALLQSVTPVMVTALYRNMKKLPATSAGLSFGLAIAAGGLPFVSSDFSAEEYSSPLIISGVLVLTAVLIYVSIQRKVTKVNA